MIWLLASGYIAFLTTHLLWLGRIPGIHYDEAWAANFAYGISSGEHPFVLHAMSPYTAPWSHYFGALFFKLFGTSLFVYRASGVIATFIGMGLIDLALWQSGRKKAAAILPWIFAFFIPLFANHRFTIEINTFHVLCFGLLFYGLFVAQQKHSRKAPILISSSILLGVTSHVLFLAPVLGLIATLLLTREAKETQETRETQGAQGAQGAKRPVDQRLQKWVTIISLIQLPFFIAISLSIPEKDKALALVIIDCVILLWSAYFKCKIPFSKKTQKRLFTSLLVLTLPSFFFLVFFSEGHWSELFHFGYLATPIWISSSLILWGITIVTLYKQGFKKHLLQIAPQEYWVWMASTVFLIGCMMLKPTPRYYEVGFIFLGISFSLLLASLSRNTLRATLLLFVLWSAVQLKVEYFKMGLQGLTQDRVFGLFFLKDRSTDNLSKQDLVSYLMSQGCRSREVSTNDPRIKEALQFLSIENWRVPANARCALKNLVVYRKADGPKENHGRSLFYFEDFTLETISDSCKAQK